MGTHRVYRSPSIAGCIICAAVATVLSVAEPAHAKSHLWRFTEVFSSADGSVQFIEMKVFDPAGTGEWVIQGMELASDANSYLFPNNLPEENTFERWMLIGTQAFADLSGAPTPDFIIPEDFFDPAGDELVYRQFRDTLTIPPETMPTDGVHSLEREFSSGDLSTPVNSPTNFAGETGSVTLPIPVPSLAAWGLFLGPLLLLTSGYVALFWCGSGAIAHVRKVRKQSPRTRGPASGP
jgi:hypothetical protein